MSCPNCDLAWNNISDGFLPENDRPVLIATKRGWITNAVRKKWKGQWLAFSQVRGYYAIIVEPLAWAEIPDGLQDMKRKER